MLTFRFSGADGVMVESETLTSGMTGKIVKLEFTSDWENRTKTAVFTAGPTTVDVLNVGEEVVIPHEVLQNYGDRLYVGVYGIAEDGTALPTIYARGPRISKGADPSGDESTQATPPVWAQLQTQIDELNKGGTGGGGGNDSEAISKSNVATVLRNIMDIFKAMVEDEAGTPQGYSTDVSTLFAQNDELIAAMGAAGKDPGEGEDPGGDEEPAVVYTVTNNLNHVSTDNDTESAEGGTMYTANLTAEDGYTISSVAVTMGGVEISAYGDGAISIDSVTGDIVITATATQMHTEEPIYVLAEPTTFAGDGSDKIDVGLDNLFNSSGNWALLITSTVAAFNWNRQTLCVIGNQATDNTGRSVEYAIAANGKYSVRNTLSAINENAVYDKGVADAKTVIVHEEGNSSVKAYYASDGAATVMEVAAGSTGAKDTSNAVTIGNSFNGVISDFQLYQRKLTETEIKTYLGVV